MAGLASAFPAAMLEAASRDPALAARTAEMAEMLTRNRLAGRQEGADAAEKLFEAVPVFDAKAQYIDVSEGSGHEYVAPGPNDLRGPCPGLNAFANHNFLPHSGYATIGQFIDVTEKVVGMGTDLAAFLAVLGGALDGDLLSWSIAGTPPAGVGGPLSSNGNGLTGSHNKYEGDASPTRPDLYEAGNNYKTVAKQFQEMIDYSPGSVTIDSLTAFRSKRFDTQIANNPYFFNGPFTGILVQPAAYTFIFRFMANHSAEYPRGYLSHEVVQSWFGVEGTNGNYKAVQGTERIPENWYRRAIDAPYTIPYFNAEVLAAAALHPKFLDVGGNTGTPNSFTGVNVADLTGGVFNGTSLAQGNNLGCFALQAAAQAEPDLLLGEFKTLLTTLGDVVEKLSCPQLEAMDESLLEMYPGYMKDRTYDTADILDETLGGLGAIV
ncbi:related to oxidase [Ramularia collo-cygni]|uniref:Related to oxidase n=1 Tax=Ramularia collo-cygni TaxID=112498 RepID=A0A2D3UVU6_9PEZI|nr:related to oxidase [Ramularia collo-cygni]CZT15146.1 related to oxidase [Ramularia collo-cygni]